MKKLLWAFFSFSFLFSASLAFADIYQCNADKSDFEAYLVFDDGLGGLDYATISYLHKEYNSSEINDDKSISDNNLPDGRYDYGFNKLAVVLKTSLHTFTLDAERANNGAAFFTGTLLVQEKQTDNKDRFDLTCIKE